MPLMLMAALALVTGCIGEPNSGPIALGSVELDADSGRADSLESLEFTLFLGDLYGRPENGAPLTEDIFTTRRVWTNVYEVGQQPSGLDAPDNADLILLADGVLLRPGMAAMDVCVGPTPPPACPSFMGDVCNEPRPPEPQFALMVLYMPQGAALSDGLTPVSVHLDLPEPASEAKRNWKVFRRAVLRPDGVEVTYAHAAVQEGEEQSTLVPYQDGASAHDFVVVGFPIDVEGSFTNETGQATYPFQIGPCNLIAE